MPAKSESQERLMQAAAHNAGGYGGVSQEDAKKFLAHDGARAAGIAFLTPDNRALFLKRSQTGDHQAEWCFPGGGLENDETAEDAAKREASEETGLRLNTEVEMLHRRISDDGVDFTTFGQRVPEAFVPTLNDEHDGFAWAPIDKPPEPLHPGVRAMLAKLATDAAVHSSLAMDRDSVRRYGRDGHMHVAVSNISKAAVNEYLGSEVPDHERLGLVPDKLYRFLRDPEELAKAAPTFNNLPLLSKHVPISADSHPSNLVIGSTGTDAEYVHPFLRNSLVVWPRTAIGDIEAEKQRELSSAYHWRADMTAGTYEGEPYDGVMRDIVGNHVATVEDGRAGSDVVVGDSNQEILMSAKLKSARAILTHGALLTFLQPKLAQDAKVDIGPILNGLTSKNFATMKPKIIAGVKLAMDGKLAKDASIDELAAVLDILEAHPAVDEMDPALPAPTDTPNTMDASPLEAIKEFLRSKGVADDVLAQLDSMMVAQDADDETDEEKKKREAKDKTAEDAEKDKDGKDMKDMVTKPAMDAAIAAAAKATAERVRAEQRAIREAEQQVRPYVGELAMAFDSADQVYRAALKIKGVVGADTIHESALPTILAMQSKIGERRPGIESTVIAQDSATISDFNKRFPDAARIGGV